MGDCAYWRWCWATTMWGRDTSAPHISTVQTRTRKIDITYRAVRMGLPKNRKPRKKSITPINEKCMIFGLEMPVFAIIETHSKRKSIRVLRFPFSGIPSIHANHSIQTCFIRSRHSILTLRLIWRLEHWMFEVHVPLFKKKTTAIRVNHSPKMSMNILQCDCKSNIFWLINQPFFRSKKKIRISFSFAFTFITHTHATHWASTNIWEKTKKKKNNLNQRLVHCVTTTTTKICTIFLSRFVGHPFWQKAKWNWIRLGKFGHHRIYLQPMGYGFSKQYSNTRGTRYKSNAPGPVIIFRIAFYALAKKQNVCCTASLLLR